MPCQTVGNYFLGDLAVCDHWCLMLRPNVMTMWTRNFPCRQFLVGLSVIKSISKPLVYICNLSLSSGIFPDDMKIAGVIKLYKAREKDLFTNYRPVSLLPHFFKNT